MQERQNLSVGFQIQYEGIRQGALEGITSLIVTPHVQQGADNVETVPHVLEGCHVFVRVMSLPREMIDYPLTVALFVLLPQATCSNTADDWVEIIPPSLRVVLQ